jgi:hypothetical protein
MKVGWIAVSITITLAGANGISAQKTQSFDPESDQMCTQAVGVQRADEDGIEWRIWQIQCAKVDLGREEKEFAALSAAETGTSKPECDAFHELMAFAVFKKLYLAIESTLCNGGTGCGVESAQKEASINYQFLLIAQGFRKNGFPTYSASDFATADQQLNTAYKNVLTRQPDTCSLVGSNDFGNCVSRSQWREMERAWIRYRDAWVAFGSFKWPQISPETLKTHLTLQQMRQLSF